MTNYRRNFLKGGAYFFTVVTYERRPLLTTETNIARLREAFRRTQQAHPFEIEAIVILPDHIHAVWQLPDGDKDFSGRWQKIKRYFSTGIAGPEVVDKSRRSKREKGIWQRRFWEHTLRDEDDWRRHLDYIHFNPVKHGYVQRPGDWPYSSFTRAQAAGWYEADWGASVPRSIEKMDLE